MMRIPLILAVACVTSAELVATNYCAQFSPSEANKTTGYFAMQIYGGVATYSYNLDLTNFNTKCEIASKGMEYHIHTSWTNSAKNSAATSLECKATGLHYDPYLACGYPSSNCSALNRESPKGYTCTPSIYSSGQYAKCQVGDTSGKFGNAFATSGLKFQQLGPLYDYHPPVAANYLVGTSRTSTFASVVFHCPGTNARLLCAKLNLIPAGQSSACSFPGTPVDSTAQVQSDLRKSKDMVYKATIAFIILAIIAFILLITTIVLSAQLCCKKKAPVPLATEERPAEAIVGNY